eukprot:Hpha_TRINITY_DN13987_c0_g5::TRINITY_DN13987_c0_g5_i1::g.35973::m.35973
MAFTMDVGSDLFGTKHNVQLRFNSRPSVAELAAAAESYFDTKSRSCRPAGYPDVLFRVETFQVFDDALMRWVDLYDGAQLQPGQQVWCFQPESIWHSDAQGVIPESDTAAFTWTTPLGSPRRGRVAVDAGVPPTLSEKLRSVFYQVDAGSKGYLVFNDLDQAFRRCDMEFNGANAGDLFQIADANRSNHITYDEWVNFAIRYPSVVDALFFRFRDIAPGGTTGQAAIAGPAASVSPTAAQDRQNQLEQYYQDSWQPSARDQQAAEFDAARARQRAAELQSQVQAASDRQRQAAEQAAAAMAQQEAAAQEASKLAAELQQAQDAAARAAEVQRLQQQAAQQQAEAIAAQQKAAQAAQQAQQAAAAAAAAPPPPQYSQPPGYGQPAPNQYGQQAPSASPQRDDALRQYEAARRHADAIRLQKEEAEREERNAWDRLYYSPASPHYAPQPQR